MNIIVSDNIIHDYQQIRTDGGSSAHANLAMNQTVINTG
ncbi:hypothetical protein AC15_3517 [Escherichia coli 2-156-04_S3_C2]|nr:hypothetical protein AC15_3517 [Escherichia coli 2-156-04_S3_C2]